MKLKLKADRTAVNLEKMVRCDVPMKLDNWRD